jgi:hypothetical protein
MWFHHREEHMMFKPEGQAQRVEVYGTYKAKTVKPDEPLYLVRSFILAICGLIELVKIFRKINKCKAYCLKHGYTVSFTAYAFELEEADQQGESMEFRSLIRDIEQDRVDMVLFIDFDWIRRKPQQVERLLKIAEEHHTTLIDVRKEQVISRPL